MPMNVTICQCSDATSSASTNARAVMYSPSRLPVPAPNRIVRYMQPKASSMPTIQNQIGMLPSKYCTAMSAASPIALTTTERRGGTRRNSTAIYTTHAAHSQMAVYERGMSGSALVIIGRRPCSRPSGEERFLPWSAHAQPLVVGHDAILVGNARHMLEIDR